MKKIQIEIPEGKRAEWVNGVLTLVDDTPKDITERIKTFKDACEWCKENGKEEQVKVFNLMQSQLWGRSVSANKDIDAYLKLRIITCALNEGKTSECDFFPYFEDMDEDYVNSDYNNNILNLTIPSSLLFKDYKLAEYAATQFKDIYMDFCKGKE